MPSFKQTAHPFEIRGDVGLLAGVAIIWTRGGSDWSVAGIKLHSAAHGGPDRTLDPWSREFERLARAVEREEGEKIDHHVATLFSREAA